MSVSQTISARGRHYGGFDGNARISQAIKKAMRDSPAWEELAPDMKEALELISTKVSRLLNGNPEHADSWHDIAGYAQLIEARLPK